MLDMGAYQQNLLKHLHHTSHPAYHDLLVKGYDGNLTWKGFLLFMKHSAKKPKLGLAIFGVDSLLKNIDGLKITFRGYGFDSFQNTAPRKCSTGIEIYKNILSHLIRVDDIV